MGILGGKTYLLTLDKPISFQYGDRKCHNGSPAIRKQFKSSQISKQHLFAVPTSLVQT